MTYNQFRIHQRSLFASILLVLAAGEALAQTQARGQGGQGGGRGGIVTGFTDIDRMTFGLHPQEMIVLAARPSVEDLVWHRLRYRFVYSGGREDAIEGTESISQILRMPVIHVLGQQSYLAGGQAAVRVIVTDSNNETIAGGGSVRIEWADAERKWSGLFAGPLNRRGTTEAQFRFPAGAVGTYSLRYVVDTAIGSTEFTQQVRLEDKVSILLTTEKPLYQPGQTIHARALALDRAGHQAAAGRKLTFEVEDSRGNKVFKKATRTDEFGIASAEFSLADEVNLGTYHLRALLGDAEGGNAAEIALNVERYVLPKFKVAVDLSGAAKKHGYRPGDHVTGTVRANYFFGKPVDGGEVTVKAAGMDVALFEAASAAGKKTINAEAKFVMCQESACKPVRESLALAIEVTPASAAGE